MTEKKTAVDQTAVSYWTDYFGEYGRQWVRDIPRRIKKALTERERERKAAAADGAVDAEFQISPLGYTALDDRMEFEGIARIGSRQVMFVASFDHEGALQDLITRDAPAHAAK